MTAEYTQITATRSPTVCDLFDRACKFAPDKDALGIDGQAWTYGMLRQSVDSLASALKSKGVAKGDRLALWLPNSAELIVRHHIIMDSLQLKLSESLAHLIVDVMRRTCGVASAVA